MLEQSMFQPYKINLLLFQSSPNIEWKFFQPLCLGLLVNIPVFFFLATGGGESARERYWGHREQEPAVTDVDYAMSNTADAEHQPLDHVSQRSHRRSCQRRPRSLSGGSFSCNFGYMALIHCILYVFHIPTNARSPHVLKYVYPLSQGFLCQRTRSLQMAEGNSGIP